MNTPPISIAALSIHSLRNPFFPEWVFYSNCAAVSLHTIFFYFWFCYFSRFWIGRHSLVLLITLFAVCIMCEFRQNLFPLFCNECFSLHSFWLAPLWNDDGNANALTQSFQSNSLNRFRTKIYSKQSIECCARYCRWNSQRRCIELVILRKSGQMNGEHSNRFSESLFRFCFIILTGLHAQSRNATHSIVEYVFFLHFDFFQRQLCAKFTSYL